MRCASTDLQRLKALRIAIPVWNGRVSPLFDTAQDALLVDVENGIEVGRSSAPISAATAPFKIRRLCDFHADVLLCGGISGPLASMVEGAGVKVVPWLAGEVDEVLRAYLADQLQDGRFLMPGCRAGGWGRRRRMGYRRRKW